MPNYKGHLLGGALFCGVSIVLLPLSGVSWLTKLEWLGCSLLGALFPDVDIKSKGQKIFYYFVAGAMIWLWCTHKIKQLILLNFISLLPLVVRHRGIFHRLWFLTLLLGIVVYFSWFLYKDHVHIILFDAFFFMVGALSHLILDFGLKRTLRLRW